MIKINRETDIAILSSAVTDFADSLRYCEYKIPLSIKGIKSKPSSSLIQGTKSHHAEEKYGQEHAELEPYSYGKLKTNKKTLSLCEKISTCPKCSFEFPNVY